VLVTGGAGFIGSNLVDALLESGAAFVRVLDNLSTGNEANLGNAKSIGGADGRFEFIKGDITKECVCEKACEGIDVVFHEAALVSVPRSMEEPILNHDINITGTLNMLVGAAAAGVKRFVYASSAATYGSLPELPKRESQPRNYPSPYALSKGVCEDYANLWAADIKLGNGMSCVGLRYFNVYGPRQDPKSVYSGVISIFASRIAGDQEITVFGDGLNTRDFVFVGDVVQANLLAGVKPMEGGAVFNVGTGNAISLLDLIGTINGVLGKSAEPIMAKERAGDIKYSVSDISKIRAELGYEPRYNLEQGLGILLKA
jgi:UDP-N-acetylglucosamine 4-epimerase